jgi:hypothetical protein
MEKIDIEKLVLGIDEDETEAWKNLQAAWQGGVLTMPADESLRRKEYKNQLRSIFIERNITPESVNDSWLAGKIKRILK